MLDKIINWSLHNRALIVFSALLFLALGLYTSVTAPVDVFPDLTAPTVTVMTEAHGMAPTEMESLITFPIEAAVNGATGVRRVRSATIVGLSIVWVEFEWGQDIKVARQIVTEKVAEVSGSLPAEAERPILAPQSSIMGEVQFVGLCSDTHSPMELRTLADSTVRRRLLAVPGVAQVTPVGGEVKQYHVLLTPDKLAAYDVSVRQVIAALAESNYNVSAGFLNERATEYLVTGIGRIASVDDVRESVIASRNGVPIRVADVGDVAIGAAIKRGDGSVNGKPAVVLGIQKQPNINTLRLTEELDKALDEIQNRLPEGITLNRKLFRQADFIQVAIGNVAEAILAGAVLVLVIMLAFLANVRATFITLTAIPLSMIAAVMIIRAFGGTINTMTLGGLAVAIGSLVDDAVIDVENIVRRLRENARLPESERRPALKVVYDASVEIRSSIVFATFIIGLVFLPVYFLTGVEGRLLRPLSTAYLISLFASLAVAVTLTPVLCSLLLSRSKMIREGREPRFSALIKGIYARILNPVLNHPWRVTIPTLLLFFAALGGTLLWGRSFLPEFNEGALNILVVTMPGTTLKDSDELGRLAEEAIMKEPEVVAVARKTGRAELDEHAQSVESAELEVNIVRKGRTKQELLAALRRNLSSVPGINFTLGQPISHRIDHMLSGSRANIAIKIFGEDLYELRRLAEQVRQAVSTVQGAVDIAVEQQTDVPFVQVIFNRPALAQYGLTVREVADAVEASFQGVQVTKVIEGRNAFDLLVRYDANEARSVDTLGEVMVDTPQGAKVPLNTLAKVVRTTGPNVIVREQVQRRIVVTCNTSERDVASIVQDCRALVDPIIAKAPGYVVEYGGQFESAEAAGRLLTIVGLGAVFGIAFLLYLAFGSGRDTAFVMINLPLALIGGVAGVYAGGGVLSVASLIGFITVFGIAARNGIMLVTHIRNLQANEGVTDFRAAVFRGASERIIPILMTALATGLALIPLALSGDKPGNEIETPMANVILFGLLTSMLLNMLIVPTLYLRFGKPLTTTETEK